MELQGQGGEDGKYRSKIGGVKKAGASQGSRQGEGFGQAKAGK
jgi:hypothetical protein